MGQDWLLAVSRAVSHSCFLGANGFVTVPPSHESFLQVLRKKQTTSGPKSLHRQQHGALRQLLYQFERRPFQVGPVYASAYARTRLTS